MSIWQAILLGIVEGITEFLPVSSTGHLIIASSIMGIAESDFTKTFNVAVQFGAILSVVVLYGRRFILNFSLYIKLFIAFLPAAVIGFLLIHQIDELLGSVITVGVTLLLGGVVLLFVDNWFRLAEEQPDREPNNLDALVIGLFQVISMIPGVSRSAATIVGGLTRNLNRKTSAEFSFFLAVPTMFAATCFKLYKTYRSTGGFTHHEIHMLLIGNLVAFIVAMAAIKGFITFLTKHGFIVFGWYRIAVGIFVLFLYFIGFKILMV